VIDAEIRVFQQYPQIPVIRRRVCGQVRYTLCCPSGSTL
jgi:hypothetical protein